MQPLRESSEDQRRRKRRIQGYPEKEEDTAHFFSLRAFKENGGISYRASLAAFLRHWIREFIVDMSFGSAEVSR